MTVTATVKLSTLRELADAGSVRSVSLRGQKGGYAVSVRYGTAERVLAGKNGDPRVFATIDTAARQLRDIGVTAFEVDVANYEPGVLRAARPALAETMRRKHAAGEHDAWFRAEVGKTLAKPNPTYIEHDALFDELEQYAAECVANAAPPTTPTAPPRRTGAAKP